HRSVRVPDVDTAVRDCGSGVEILPAAEMRVRGRPPALPPCPRIDRVDVARVGPEEHASAGGRGRAVHLGTGIEAPEHPRSIRPPHVEGVQMAVPRAEVEPVLDEQRRRLDRAGSEAPEDLREMIAPIETAAPIANPHADAETLLPQGVPSARA